MRGSQRSTRSEYRGVYLGQLKLNNISISRCPVRVVEGEQHLSHFKVVEGGQHFNMDVSFRAIEVGYQGVVNTFHSEAEY